MIKVNQLKFYFIFLEKYRHHNLLWKITEKNK